MDFLEITPQELNEGACKLIGKDWMLVTAGNREKVNTMTASWGGLGEMWARPAAFVVIRPTRYTKEFVDASDTLSLTFYPERYRKELSYLGSVSGRDEDKIRRSGLTVAFYQDTPYFEEARIVMIVRKLYADTYRPSCFVDRKLTETLYPQHDFHTLYICEIQKVLTAAGRS
ncbi:MAG: flavin reductase family protein [Clostridium sp.]|jgi:flavin reductase (DIM6/NTAB) family NADH-FMN oxidoreductase RutF|nr:flavin reductase family protein [Clostridium sp.]